MELILMSIAGTSALLVTQLVEFVRWEATGELRSRICSIPGELVRRVESLTPTVTVAITVRT